MIGPDFLRARFDRLGFPSKLFKIEGRWVTSHCADERLRPIGPRVDVGQLVFS